MKLPHSVKFNAFWPRLFGNLSIGRPFAAATVFCWTFMLPGQPLDYKLFNQIVRHEYQHAKQFWYGFAIGVGLWLLTTPHWLWLLLTPLTFTFAYGLASLVAWLRKDHPYRGNYFEKQARRAAGEPV